MTSDELRALSPALDTYLRKYLFCFASTLGFDQANIYIRGLLSDLERKTAEPIALAAGKAPRTMQQFLTTRVWDQERFCELTQIDVLDFLPTCVDTTGLGTIGIFDDTGIK